MVNIGFDIDGVLADFHTAYRNLVINQTGKDLFEPVLDSVTNLPTVWGFDSAAGYSKKEISAAWKEINRSGKFWEYLDHYDETPKCLATLQDSVDNEMINLYFISNRPMHGSTKKQTEAWLRNRGAKNPTVILTQHKRLMIRGLDLSAVVEDKLENANEYMATARSHGLLTRVYLLEAPYNEAPIGEITDNSAFVTPITSRDPALIPVKSVTEMLKMEGF